MCQLLLLAVLLAPVPTTPPCDAVCELRAAEVLLDRGESRAAVARLREATTRFPEDRHLVLLLARAYMVENNLFWAERSLREAIDRWPEDVQLRAWLAAVHLRQGDPDLVAADLDPDLEPSGGAARTRWSLLEVSRARLAGEQDGMDHTLAGLGADTQIYPEDMPLWRMLQQSADPWWIEAFTFDLELSLGRTSNALAGSPTDPGASGGPSWFADSDLRGRFEAPVSGPLRPLAELRVAADYLAEEEYRELSSLQIGGRLGAVAVGEAWRLSFGYDPEVLYLDQEDSLYAEAHRVGAELERSSGWLVFGGGGHRSYRDEKRTRWEGEAGIGGPLRWLPGVSALGGLTLRLADAESSAYDQRGVSAVVATRFDLGHGFFVRVGLSGSWDDYPHSGGEDGLSVFGTEERRRDLLGRLTLSLWIPPWRGLRTGLEFQRTERNSTADQTPGFDFSYSEWRAVVLLRYSFAIDPWAPQKQEEAGHIALDWGLERDQGMDEERILDLLRQDEELRRGTSCGVP